LTLREGALDPGGDRSRQRHGIGRVHTLHREVAPGIGVEIESFSHDSRAL